MLPFNWQTIERNIIWSYKARKNEKVDRALDPNEWLSEAVHELNPSVGIREVNAWVLQELEKPMIINGWDKHFDKSIYDQYNHKNLIRAFVPIIACSENGEINKIGTLEAGYNISRKEDIDDTELEMLKALANQAAIAINNSRNCKEIARLKDLEVEATKDNVWEHVAKEIPHKMTTNVESISIDLRYLKRILISITKDVNEKDEIDSIINNLVTSSNDVLKFLNELKSFPNVKKLMLKRVKLIDFLTEIVKNSVIPCKIDVYDKVPDVSLDEAKIRAAFKELLSNAVDFVEPDKGLITIRVRLATDEEKSKLPIDRKRGYVKINFRDNGKGVPLHLKKRIFEPMVSAKRCLHSSKRISSGLGLSIVKKHILEHMGYIKEVGFGKEGADFEIFLPIELSY